MGEYLDVTTMTAKEAVDRLEQVPEIVSSLAEMETHASGFVNVMSFGAKGDGDTNDTVAIQNAIDSMDRGIVFFPPKTFIASGLVPKSNITLMGYGATLKLPESPINNLINYYSNTQLLNFNLVGLSFKSDSTTFDLVSISQSSPSAPDKTWYMSSIRDCNFKGGKRGIYCPVPGSVKIESCYFDTCDIGLEWDNEHFYVNNSVFWYCRRGIECDKGNHFSIINGVFAHSDEYGVYYNGFESHFIGCSFIDNKIAGIYGDFNTTRIEANRILQNGKGIYCNGSNNIILGNQIWRGTDARDIVDISGVTAIELGNTAGFNTISSNNIRNYYKGIVCNGDSNDIRGNIFSTINDAAIIINQIRCAVQDNRINSVGEGIRITKENYDICIKNNEITLCEKNGILSLVNITGLMIVGNKIYDNSTLENNVYSGIKIDGLVLSGVIADNLIRNSGVGQMKHAIEMAANPSTGDCLVANNVSRNLKGDGNYVLPISVTKANNIGSVVDV